tara:strand:- start:172 stop:801 length:630 start_codon:yes stop_codon:yes gene_type:complete
VNNLLKIIFFNFLFFSFVFSEESLNDDDYYKKGVKLYDQGDFKKSFIVFFNLSEKGNKDAIYNLSNMYSEGIGTVQDYNSALKYTWLCSLNGNNKCIKKINKLTEKMDEKEVTEIATNIPKTLEDDFLENNNAISAFKLGYWYEKISPEIDFEKSYLWYSVSVTAGVYKAMKLRDRVGEKVEKGKLKSIQQEANDIFTKDKYFGKKDEL